jgi:hypothetical protein
MAIDPVAAAFFSKHSEDPANSVCCDGGEEEAAWASVSHGIYLSIGAAGIHRSLGAKVSFVQSTTMDSWKPKHLKMMELGGNQQFNKFLEEQGVPLDMPIREKYSTRAAVWYREDLNARAEGFEPLSPLPLGTGHLPAEVCTSAMHHVLDEVFAASPRRGTMTRGGVCQDQACQEASSPRKLRSDTWQTRPSQEIPADAIDTSISRGICETLSACFKLAWCSNETACTSEAAESTDSVPLKTASTPDFTPDLPILLGSSQCPNAKRLQTFSTGMMVGLSPADFPPCLATPEEMSRQIK